ncbi:MAG: hypothetical protein QY318_00415 [Candidatus Dojkabacteria bacterium]|nr:MAG: hypothetical protein QY318_00415 [Candidatus Dojkabacteria bacterium]
MRKYLKYIVVGAVLLIALLLRFAVFPFIDMDGYIARITEAETDKAQAVETESNQYVKQTFIEGRPVEDDSQRNFTAGTLKFEETSFELKYTDGNQSSKSAVTTNQSTEQGYIGREFIYRGAADTVVALTEGSMSVPLLETDKTFEGYNAIYYSRDDGSTANVNSEGSLVIDYDVSDDGNIVGLLEARFLSATTLKRNICNNCTDVEMSIYFVNYDIPTRTKIGELYLRDLSILVNPAAPDTIESIESIDLNKSNISTIDFNRRGYASLHGNDLLNITLDLSDDGRSFVYKYFDIYTMSGESEIIVADISQLADRYSDGEELQYSSAWLPGNRYVLTVDSIVTGEYFTNIVSLDDGSSNVLKSPIKISSGWPLSSTELLVEAVTPTGREVSLLDQFLSFEDRTVYLPTENPQIANVVVAAVNTERGYIIVESVGGFYYYELSSGDIEKFDTVTAQP